MNRERIVILGGGESGVGAALLAKKRGYTIFLSDRGSLRPHYRAELQKEGIPFEEGGHTDQIYQAQRVIKSPGIPENAKVLDHFREKGVTIIAEIEFAYQHCEGTLIAITGTNGKTTTTLLTQHLLERAGRKSIATGNVGYSFSRAVAEGYDFYVVEVSSFQLDGITSFRPHIAVITNITPDHLDRYHNDFEAYALSKMRITMNQIEEDHLIVCKEDPKSLEMLSKTVVKAQLHAITLTQDQGAAAWLNGHHIIIPEKNNQEISMTLEELALQGRHNVYNSMAAGVAGRLIDIRKDSIKQSLSDFKNEKHRLETVATIHGVTYINDSKATNINAAWFALESQQGRVIWIAGGVDKGNDYMQLMEQVKSRVEVLICLGKDTRKLAETFINHVEKIHKTESMEEAVTMAYQAARPGDTVLLAPACASFDLFENYEERGNRFINAVKKL
ncbi:MAG: UDP-N-acetylmuramoyl-L-alanine--D-glutamate ligase [Bacteroidetes bacterium]|nr:MAG: UDP-N-acetylmuramoyl-L-alanine--D-glutamate ligase [Bacteroidota bacterium]PIE88172.1 MAG: UDP-N-acetylmuramoyl-L-alanine--D-glutamate ligase [Bacteroidota bacterium]